MADQFQREFERLGQALLKGERDHFEGIAPQRFEGVAQVALAGHKTS
jgi:6,7-dimethyl-8-ribityllumazine synthase